jgi:UDP-glucuronate 4-epimerase
VPDPATSWAPHRVFNSGNSNPTPLLESIEAIEAALGVTAADTSALEAWTGFKPNTPVREGVARFVDWYRDFYGV